nr:hypothetical protein [Tanacetum cinerariifolium]
MDHQYLTVAKIPVLDTGKFEQWQFQIQQYLQHEHYALWEVIEFDDSYKVPTNTDPDDTTTKRDVEQSGRTVTFTTEDMNDLDSMSLDDLYNHLKVYEAEVHKKFNSNSQDMAFIFSSKNSSNEDGNTVCVTTASTAFPTSSVNVATISQDTASAYIASQSNGSQIKFEDINQIDEDDMEEMDIKWNMALLSMRADTFWKRTGKKISLQGSDVADFDKSKVECFNYHKMGHFARECRAPRSQERGRKESYRQGSKAKEKISKALTAIDGVGWDWSYMANEEDHELVADGEAPTEFALMANIENKEVKLEKDGLDGKLAGLLKDSKNLDHLIESQRSDQKDLSWTGLPEFVDDTVTNYNRPSPTIVSTSAEEFVLHKKPCFNCGDFSHLANDCRRSVQRETTRSQNHPYKSSSHRSGGHRPHGAPMRPPLRSSGHRPHGGSMRPSHRSAGHRPHGLSINPKIPIMNGARPYKSFFIQSPSYETRPFLKS